MIAFDSPEGAALRALAPSAAAVVAIWFTAVTDGTDGWSAWAGEELARHPVTVDVTALRFLQAARDGDQRRAHQLWMILASMPVEGTPGPIVATARVQRASMTF